MEKCFKCFIYIPEKPFLEPVRILIDRVPDDPSIPQEFRGQKASTTPIYPNKVVKAEDWLFKGLQSKQLSGGRLEEVSCPPDLEHIEEIKMERL